MRRAILAHLTNFCSTNSTTNSPTKAHQLQFSSENGCGKKNTNLKTLALNKGLTSSDAERKHCTAACFFISSRLRSVPPFLLLFPHFFPVPFSQPRKMSFSCTEGGPGVDFSINVEKLCTNVCQGCNNFQINYSRDKRTLLETCCFRLPYIYYAKTSKEVLNKNTTQIKHYIFIALFHRSLWIHIW